MISLLHGRQKRTPIGIDAGANGARAVQLVRDEGGYRMLHAVCSELPFSGAGDEHRAMRMGRQINACIRQGLFKGTAAVAGLDTPDIEFHTLELPRASGPELEQIVRLEVERLMTLSANDAEIRHWILPEANASAPNALGVVAPTEVILETLNACHQAKLVCSAVHPSATALCRLGCLLQKYESEAIWGVLDLGNRQTRVIVCADEVPVLVRSVGRGGSAWTQRIAEALQTSFKTAEVQKREHGITPPARAGAAGFSPRGVPNADGVAGLRSTAQAEACGSGMSSMLLGILRSNLNELAQEVKRSFEYVLTCYPSRQALGLILVGGGAALHNLPEFLSDSLGIVVHRASHFLNEPACRLHYEAVGQNPLERFALAVGLAVEE